MPSSRSDDSELRAARLRPVADHIRRLLRDRTDPRGWIEANLRIRDKHRRVVPFRLNFAQQDYYGNRTNFDVILKPRQLGFTTEVEALLFADTILRPNTSSVVVAHELESTKRIFRMIQLFWECLPEEVKRVVGPPSHSNRREFFWPTINSHFYIGTAGAFSFGRGMTLNNVHASEFAFWPRPEEALIAIMEAVPREGGRIIVESTPNGIGNFFHDFWVAAEEERNGFCRQFYVWWEEPTYRTPGEALDDLTAEEQELKRRWKLDDAQIRWRRQAQQRLGTRFHQEYPEDHTTCFLTSGRMVFDLGTLQTLAARLLADPKPTSFPTLPDGQGGRLPLAPTVLLVWQQPEAGHDYVIGADVGEGLADGDASSAFVLERESGIQVAELHGRVPPERFARQLDALGRYYRGAELAVECNNHGHSVLNTLRHVLRYPRLYWHVRYDHRVGDQLTLGWPTNAQTKPILVDDLAAAILAGHLGIRSQGLVDELFTFVSTNSGAQQAQEGKYDDRVLAAGIAWQVRKRPRSRGTTQRPEGM